MTTNYIFDEALTLARVRLGHAAAVELGEAIQDSYLVELIRLLPEDEEDAWSMFRRHSDKEYSFTDCTSFVVMHRLRLERAIALDSDFRQAGFAVEP